MGILKDGSELDGTWRLLYSSNPRMDEFSMEVHHGGKFLSDPIRYVGVAINYFDGNKQECLSAQELRNMVEKLGYMSYGKLWYRMPMGHKVIELYVEDCMYVPNIIDDVGEDINYFDNSKDSSGSDDAFDKMVMGPIDLGQASKEQDSNKVMGSNAKIVTGLSDNDQPYESEELLSMDDDDDNNATPPYPMFVPPTNPKHTNFVKGMLFISLEQFKNVVTNYAVHGGWGIRFKKNDKVRVKAIYQGGCKWIAFVAKMRDQMTFQMRTYYGRHTCTRTFKNMRCTSKWLGKTPVSELSDHPDTTNSTIVKRAQEKYVIHISRSKAHRAKVCAQDMITGSSVLLNVVTANLPIEEIERPGRTLCPLFQRLTFIFDQQKGLIPTFEELMPGRLVITRGRAKEKLVAIKGSLQVNNRVISHSLLRERVKGRRGLGEKAIDTPRGKIKPWVSNVPLPEIWGPPPSWKGNSSVTKETLMTASQTARYRETFNILGSQELVHAPPSFRGQSEKGKEGSRG
nr:hypothetical protein CFP56_61293 [Quercus suber]